MAFALVGSGGNCNGCEWIAADGPITTHTPDDFAAALTQWGDLDGRETIYLNSPGGDLISGLLLGEAIRVHRFSVSVGRNKPVADDPGHYSVTDGMCSSACAYAFLGGLKRTASAKQLGFHQFSFPRSVEDAVSDLRSDTRIAEVQRLAGLLAVYLREMGADPRLLFIASRAAPQGLVTLDDAMMHELGVTNVSDAGVFGGWTIEPYRGGAVVAGRLTNTQLEDQQFAFYCRTNAPGTVFLRSSWSYASADKAHAAADDAFLKSAVWGSTVSIGEHAVRQTNGYGSIVDAHVDADDTYQLTYAISAAEFSAAARDGRLTIGIAGPHALGSYGFRLTPPMKGIDAPARIAFKSYL